MSDPSPTPVHEGFPSRSVPLPALVVSAEHGGNRVPVAYSALFEGHDRLLSSHRGWDPGTADLARRLSGHLGCPAIVSTSTRLLVDLNRSPHHPRVFSELTRSLPPADRQEILDRYHTPRRRVVERAVRDGIARGGTTVHLALHSFTPVLDGVPRHTDLALLYDPRRGTERDLARVWVRELRGAFDGWRIRRNHPYRGTSDGLTTTLRRLAPEERYLGIEIELSQGRLDDGGRYPPGLEQILARTLATAWTAVSRG